VISVYNVLYVDDEPSLLEIGKLFLEEGGQFIVDTITSAPAALALLNSKTYDAIISDYQMPEMDGIEFLKMVRTSGSIIPFILFTGRGREEVVIEALNAGADFYLQKGGEPESQFVELAHNVNSAISRKKADAALRESEDTFKTLFESGGAAIFTMDHSFFLDCNRRTEELFRCPRDQIIGHSPVEFSPERQPDGQLSAEKVKVKMDAVFLGEEQFFDWVFVHHDGTLFNADVTLNRVMVRGKHYLQGIVQDITERKRAEKELLRKNEELAASGEDLKSQFDALAESERIARFNVKQLIMSQEIGHTGSWQYHLVTGNTWGSAEALRLFGFPPVAGDFPIDDKESCIPERERVHQALVDLITAGKEYNLEYVIHPADGSAPKVIHSIARLETNAQGNTVRVVGVFHDITKRKMVQDALKESENRFRQVAESAGEWVWEVDADGLYTYSSPSVERMLGYRPDEIVGRMHFYDLLAPEMKEELKKAALETFATKKSFKNFVYPTLHKNGNRVLLETSGVPFMDKQDRLIGYRGTDTDITESKQAEKVLKESEENFKALAENANDGILVAVSEGSHRFVNRRACEITGYSVAELLKKGINDLAAPDEVKNLREMFRKRLAGEDISQLYETFIIRKDGKSVPIEITSAKTFWHGQPADLVIIRDITGRKRAEEALRESEESLRTIIEQSPLSIEVMSPDGWTLQVNHAFEELWGVTLEDLKDYNMLRDEQLTLLGTMPYIRRGFSGEAVTFPPVQYDGNRTLGSGKKRWVQGRIYPVRDAARTIRNVILVHEDITERKRDEEALQQANKKLTILSSITRHDIDNQITSLLGFLRILEKKQPDPTLSEYFRKISTAAKSITAMIRFTKEYEKIGVHAPVWQDIHTLVRTAAEEVPLGKVTLKNDLPAGTVVYVDPMIVKVFYNLMDNAEQYGRKITTIRFSVQESGDGHLIVCEDDGEGVPADEKERIFYREFGKNNGMGLFLAREILSITGITIRETGEPGKGARFEIMVPNGAYRVTGMQKKNIPE
jgi:PAS domain S-box-containing protein